MMHILNAACVATAERWPHQLTTNAVRGEEMPASPTCNCFTQLVLDVAMNYRADVMAANPNRDNDGFRHAACRQYIFMATWTPWSREPKRYSHHVSFGQLEINFLPPMESTPAIGQTEFRTVLLQLFFSSCKYIF